MRRTTAHSIKSDKRALAYQARRSFSDKRVLSASACLWAMDTAIVSKNAITANTKRVHRVYLAYVAREISTDVAAGWRCKSGVIAAAWKPRNSALYAHGVNAGIPLVITGYPIKRVRPSACVRGCGGNNAGRASETAICDRWCGVWHNAGVNWMRVGHNWARINGASINRRAINQSTVNVLHGFPRYIFSGAPGNNQQSNNHHSHAVPTLHVIRQDRQSGRSVHVRYCNASSYHPNGVTPKKFTAEALTVTRAA